MEIIVIMMPVLGSNQIEDTKNLKIKKKKKEYKYKRTQKHKHGGNNNGY